MTFPRDIGELLLASVEPVTTGEPAPPLQLQRIYPDGQVDLSDQGASVSAEVSAITGCWIAVSQELPLPAAYYLLTYDLDVSVGAAGVYFIKEGDPTALQSCVIEAGSARLGPQKMVLATHELGRFRLVVSATPGRSSPGPARFRVSGLRLQPMRLRPRSG
jgi:hypothetical protein